MQPFETPSENPQPQGKATYPTLDSQPQEGQNAQPQAQNPQPQPQLQYPRYQNPYSQPQGQYPQYQGQYNQQRPSYPNYQQQRPAQPYPQNYQAPYGNQGYQQPGAYQNYQAAPQYAMYNQGANQGKSDVHRLMLAQQLSKSRNGGSGKVLVIVYSLLVAAASALIAITMINQTNYQVLLTVYEKIAGRAFNPADSFSPDTCQAFLADILAAPVFLFAFAAFNVLAMLVAFTGGSFCMFIQPLAALVWAGIAVFAAQQKCVGYSILTTMFGANNIPQNAAPFYGAMAVASVISCLLNWSWSSNEEKAKRDQKNLALMMAAS